MSETQENNTTTTKAPAPKILTPFSNSLTNPGETIVNLGEARPTEYSIKPVPAADSHNTYNVVKKDNRSAESRQREYQNRRESTIQNIMQALKSNRNSGTEVVSELDVDLTGEMIAELVREARARLQKQSSELEEQQEERRQKFQEKLQASREVCTDCGALLGWQPESLDRHQKTCSAYLQRKRDEEQRLIRRRNFTQRYERLLDHDIPNTINAALSTTRTINEIKFLQAEAVYTNQDHAIIEALEDIKDRFRREGDYDRQRRNKRVADLRNFATVLESFYRTLEEEAAEEEQSSTMS